MKKLFRQIKYRTPINRNVKPVGGEYLKREIFVFNEKRELIMKFNSVKECAKYFNVCTETILNHRKKQTLLNNKYYFSLIDLLI